MAGPKMTEITVMKEQKYMASCIKNAEYFEITSDFGHDGFLLEWEQLTKIIEPLLG